MEEICIYYCPDCLDELREYGEPAYNIYLDICVGYIQNAFYSYAIYNIYSDASEVIKFLEHKKFIISSDSYYDSRFCINVKPIGYEYIDKRTFGFCSNRCMHFKKN